MANRYRGEINAHFNGQDYTLCLTLGALAQLEDVFKADDMLCVAERFSSGRISARDCLKIIGIGLRAAGHDITDEVVATFQSPRGAAGFVQIVASLLEATFGAESQPADVKPKEVVSQETPSINTDSQNLKKNRDSQKPLADKKTPKNL